MNNNRYQVTLERDDGVRFVKTVYAPDENKARFHASMLTTAKGSGAGLTTIVSVVEIQDGVAMNEGVADRGKKLLLG